MSKMKELSLAVDELKRCGEALISISETLADLFSSKPETKEPPAAEVKTAETPAKVYTLSEVRAILAEKSRSGHTAEVRQLLLKYGAEKLSEIKESDYASLVAEAEVINDT
jgi:hypothetical protein